MSDLPAARTLAQHSLDPVTGRCAGCGQACPCSTANQAAAILAAAGTWDPPVRESACSSATGPDRGRRRPLTALRWRRTNP